MRSPLAAIIMFAGATASPHTLIGGTFLFFTGLALEVSLRIPRGPRQP